MWVSDDPSLGPINGNKAAVGTTWSRASVALIALWLVPQGLWAQTDDTLTQDLRRIFEHKSFELEDFGPAKWLDEGAAYTVLEPPTAEPVGESEVSDSAADESGTEARDVVRYDTATAQRTVMVEASKLIPKGAEESLPSTITLGRRDGLIC